MAGKSIVLLREIFEDFALNHEKSLEQQKINVYVIGPATTSLFEQFMHEVLEHFPQGPNYNPQNAPPPKKEIAKIKLDLEMNWNPANPTAPFLESISSYMGDEISPFLPQAEFTLQPLPENTETTKLFVPTPLPHLPNDVQGKKAKKKRGKGGKQRGGGENE